MSVFELGYKNGHIRSATTHFVLLHKITKNFLISNIPTFKSTLFQKQKQNKNRTEQNRKERKCDYLNIASV